jgi:hypothetical protein
MHSIQMLEGELFELLAMHLPHSGVKDLGGGR